MDSSGCPEGHDRKSYLRVAAGHPVRKDFKENLLLRTNKGGGGRTGRFETESEEAGTITKGTRKTVFSLFEIKQNRDESLRAYIRKFNKPALEVSSCAPETKTMAFTQGLQEEDFFWPDCRVLEKIGWKKYPVFYGLIEPLPRLLLEKLLMVWFMDLKSDKFISFVVTERGIEVNLEKVKAILEMVSPKNIKDIEKLTCRIAVLSQFISRSTYRSYHFFEILRKARRFGWDDKTEQAFPDLKNHLAGLPSWLNSNLFEEVWRVFVDGAASKDGSGVGVVIVSPTGEKIKFAMRLDFRASNNEVEYKSMVIGRKTAREAGATRIILYSDSQLVIQQVKGSYEAREWMLKEYLKVIQELSESFIEWSAEQFPREENVEADARKDVIYHTKLVSTIDTDPVTSQENSWRMPLLEFISTNWMSEDPQQGQKIKRQCSHFSLINGELYRRSFRGPMLKCLAAEETKYVLRKIHDVCCGDHLETIALTRKALFAGFWWPAMNTDTREMVWSYEEFQRRGNFCHSTASSLKHVRASCSLDQLSLDIVGPFLVARAQKKFLLVAVDYFSKWVEAQPLTKITEDEVLKFLWKNIVCRFGLPRKLKSDNGRQIQGYSDGNLSWIEENNAARAQELDLIKETRERAAIRTEAYRRRVIRAYNQRVRPREFQVGDLVLKKTNPVGDVGKLEVRWEGPYKMVRRLSS
ncbi:uncharacterized protein [Primulina huaijiensis]|uniref:uncharacterized protein n=1 Tax=Primulina huaijiensis TaxID=1492673 RepID=UPI003CC71F72